MILRRVVSASAALVALLLAGNLAGQQPGPVKAASEKPQASAGQVKVIEMTSKKYEYSPNEIHVKKGARVQLKIRPLDRTHGFKVSLYPDGAEQSGPPGLKFDPAQDNFKIEKGQERVIEFVAERAGTYPFKCSVFCGFRHHGMKGKVIVEE